MSAMPACSAHAFRQTPQILEQNFHVAQSRAIVHHAPAQAETSADSRVREIRAAVARELDEQTFVPCIQFFVAVMGRHMAKTKDGKLDWREHLEIVAGPHEAFEMSGAGQVLLDRFAESAQAN